MTKIHHMTLAGTATVGPKGQVVIPADVRSNMNIEPGTKLIVFYNQDKKAVSFIAEAEAQAMIDKMGEQLLSIQTLLKEGKYSN